MERERFVFEMPHDERGIVFFRKCRADAALFAFAKDLEFAVSGKIVAAHLRVAAVGHGKCGRKPFHRRAFGQQDFLLENAEHLARQGVLGNFIKMIERSLRRPANIQHGQAAASRLVHHLLEQLPIAYLLKRNIFERRTCDNQPVGLGEHLGREFAVELQDVFHRRGLERLPRQAHEGEVHRLPGLGEGAGDVEFRHKFLRHEVEQ